MIYLIRHGEPEAGWGAHPDPGLSTLGHQQAQKISDRLTELGATGLISSPLLRCQETSQPFAASIMAAPVILRDEVAEVVTPEGVEDRQAWLRTTMSGTWSEAGQTLQAWRERAYEAIRELPDNTAVFSHFVAINAIVSKVTDSDQVRVFNPGHCSVTVLSRDDGGLTVDAFGSEGPLEVM